MKDPNKSRLSRILGFKPTQIIVDEVKPEQKIEEPKRKQKKTVPKLVDIVKEQNKPTYDT